VDRFDEGWDSASSIGVSPDGDKVFVTGSSGTLNFRRYLTIAYDARTGARLWVARYGEPMRDINFATSLGVSPDGTKVFVTGDVSSEEHAGYGTVAYDAATGTELWVALLDGGSAADLQVSPDGSKVIVTGGNAGDYATVAYAAGSGAQLWVARYNGPENGEDFAHAVSVSPDGTKLFVSGASTGATGGLDYATVAYAATAGAPVQLWVARYDGPGNDRDVAYSLGMSPDGTSVFVTGESQAASGDPDYATIAYDVSSGAIRWVMRYGGPYHDVASSLVVSSDGTKVFVTGYDSVGPSNEDRNYATIAYDAQAGASLWARRYSRTLRGGEDRAFSIDVSPDGSEVFVTGTSFDELAVAFATVAYDTSTGASLWVSRYEDPSDQAAAAAIAASPDGTSVFVTGDLHGIDTSIVTIAYSTR